MAFNYFFKKCVNGATYEKKVTKSESYSSEAAFVLSTVTKMLDQQIVKVY